MFNHSFIKISTSAETDNLDDILDSLFLRKKSSRKEKALEEEIRIIDAFNNRCFD